MNCTHGVYFEGTCFCAQPYCGPLCDSSAACAHQIVGMTVAALYALLSAAILCV